MDRLTPVTPGDVTVLEGPVPASELPGIDFDHLMECVLRDDPGAFEELLSRDRSLAVDLATELSRSHLDPDSAALGRRWLTVADAHAS